MSRYSTFVRIPTPSHFVNKARRGKKSGSSTPSETLSEQDLVDRDVVFPADEVVDQTATTNGFPCQAAHAVANSTMVVHDRDDVSFETPYPIKMQRSDTAETTKSISTGESEVRQQRQRQQQPNLFSYYLNTKNTTNTTNSGGNAPAAPRTPTNKFDAQKTIQALSDVEAVQNLTTTTTTYQSAARSTSNVSFAPSNHLQSAREVDGADNNSDTETYTDRHGLLFHRKKGTSPSTVHSGERQESIRSVLLETKSGDSETHAIYSSVRASTVENQSVQLAASNTTGNEITLGVRHTSHTRHDVNTTIEHEQSASSKRPYTRRNRAPGTLKTPQTPQTTTESLSVAASDTRKRTRRSSFRGIIVESGPQVNVTGEADFIDLKWSILNDTCLQAVTREESVRYTVRLDVMMGQLELAKEKVFVHQDNILKILKGMEGKKRLLNEYDIIPKSTIKVKILFQRRAADPLNGQSNFLLYCVIYSMMQNEEIHGGIREFERHVFSMERAG